MTAMEEKCKALRFEGLTYREIGVALHITGQRAWQLVNREKKANKRKCLTEKDCRYARIREWANESGIGIGKMSMLLYGRRDSTYPQMTRRMLTGDGYLHKDKIDILLREMGVSYEEAFSDGQDEQG